MTRTLPLLALVTLVACAPNESAVDYTADATQQMRGEEVQTVDATLDTSAGTARVCKGSQCSDKVISGGASKGQIECDPTADECPELIVYPLGPMTMTSSLNSGLSMGYADNLARFGDRGATATFGTPRHVENVYVLDGGTFRGRQANDVLLIELDGSRMYLVEGDIEGDFQNGW